MQKTNPFFATPLVMLALFLLMLPACDNSAGPAPRTYDLVWEDNFEGAQGQLPDASKWGYDIGTDWGNQQLEYDTNRPENVSLDGQGNLAITARQENHMGQPYTSARIVTRDLFSQTYGRFEARMQLPTGQGLWPAFWLLGTNIDSVGWPACGEIDIMEYRGQEPSTIHGTVHGPGYSAAGGVTQRFDLTDGRFDTGFHVFAIEWGVDFIDWYVDDKLYHSIAPEDLPARWVFDHEFYIILNLAVGGGYVGPPGAQTIFPQTMLVDWVRVHKERS